MDESFKKQYPQIYVYEDRHQPGWLKVGFTTKKNAEERVREQFNTRLQIDKNPYVLHHVQKAIDINGVQFMDHDVHKILVNRDISKKGEFFKTDINTVKSAILAVIEGKTNIESRHETFAMRAEQAEAVKMTKSYFEKCLYMNKHSKPQFLWNAKMRFGKTFAAYQLALSMNFKKVLVLTYKPAVEDSWYKDLMSHLDFLNWQFASRKLDNLDSLDKSKPFVYFASFQDMLGEKDGEIKIHNEWVHKEKWDMIIQDEYHYGAWRDTAKELLDETSIDIAELSEENKVAKDVIDGKCFLYLSGTPFRAIDSGEFLENQIFNWTYADEQRVKEIYEGENNPYASLPQMNIYTYQLPDKLKAVALKGNYDEFSLSHFFKAKGEKESAEFINVTEVQSWLDLLEGKFTETTKEDGIENELKRNGDKIPFPFSRRTSLYRELSHMVWYLPNVASCYAMEKLLTDPKNNYYNKYKIIVVAGERGGSGAEALTPVREAMGDPLKTKTITLTCGKLMTGVTVPAWSAIFMLSTLRSPESYFQSAFRVQSPWVIKDGLEIPKIQKHKCYVFDFDPNRALSQIATYSSKLDQRDVTTETKISEFIKYLPILAYDGFNMEEIDARGLLDISIGQTTSTLLAKGWNNALLVNVDTNSLQNLINNKEAMNIINSIESFRKVTNKSINVTTISKSEVLKKLQTKKYNKEKLSKDEKKELSQEVREYNKGRMIVREKLQTLATRIPLFMYLTDYREEKLTDIITKLQPELFKKVTGLTIADFELLIELDLFNSELMNDVVYKFRKYEDASMSYSGINRHEGEAIAGFDEMNKTNIIELDEYVKLIKNKI